MRVPPVCARTPRGLARGALLGLLLLAGSGAPARAQERPQPGPPRGRPSPEAIERWKRLSPEERARLRERYEAWKGMDEAERDELRRRHERLREAERDVRRDLPPEARRSLEELGPQERRELLREHLEQELVERGRRMRRLLPPELREQLESASPEERARLMGELRRRFEQEGLRRGLREVGRELGLAPDEVEALQALPVEVQRAKLLQLRRLEILRRVAREGLPEWITSEQWADWQGLSDERFLERLHAARPRRGGEGPREVWRLMRPDPRWFEELAALSPEERRDELDRRLAGRLLEELAGRPELLPPEELAALRGLPPPEVLERVRARLRGPSGGWHGERGRGRRHDGDGPRPRPGGEGRGPGGGRR
jgi:hypothetical protein